MFSKLDQGLAILVTLYTTFVIILAPWQILNQNSIKKMNPTASICKNYLKCTHNLNQYQNFDTEFHRYHSVL